MHDHAPVHATSLAAGAAAVPIDEVHLGPIAHALRPGEQITWTDRPRGLRGVLAGFVTGRVSVSAMLGAAIALLVVYLLTLGFALLVAWPVAAIVGLFIDGAVATARGMIEPFAIGWAGLILLFVLHDAISFRNRVCYALTDRGRIIVRHHDELHVHSLPRPEALEVAESPLEGAVAVWLGVDDLAPVGFEGPRGWPASEQEGGPRVVLIGLADPREAARAIGFEALAHHELRPGV